MQLPDVPPLSLQATTTDFHSPASPLNCTPDRQAAAPWEYFVPLQRQSTAAPALCTPNPRSAPPNTAVAQHRTLRFMILLLSNASGPGPPRPRPGRERMHPFGRA